MGGDRRLLVVDDEALICQACERVFSRQGYEVETRTDPRAGLAEATNHDYDAVLLDIRMPGMDGLRFLEALRKAKPDLPVVMMTGYPSVSSAASALRLGASDYLAKPFTPEQITLSVRRMLGRGAADGYASSAVLLDGEAGPRLEEFLFLDEAWVQPEMDGVAVVGACVARPETPVSGLFLPEEGDTLYQGLPLAGVTFDDGTMRIIASPVSGIVTDVHRHLAEKHDRLFDDPFRTGWIARVCATRFEEESERLTSRRVVVVGADPATTADYRERLAWLGCRAVTANEESAWNAAIAEPTNDVFLLDADSLGGGGPELVRKIHATGRAAKIIVTAATDYRWEAAYRDEGIFYYAVAPFADGEIGEVLRAVFVRPQRPGRSGRRRSGKSLHAIRVTNRGGRKTQLLAGPGLLSSHEGLGSRIVEKLMEQYVPVETDLGETEVTPDVVLDAARLYDRVMVLTARDMGRLPGSLVRDAEVEYVSAARENASRTTTLVVQPDREGGLTGLDERTVEALAGHVAGEMLERD